MGGTCTGIYTVAIDVTELPRDTSITLLCADQLTRTQPQPQKQPMITLLIKPSPVDVATSFDISSLQNHGSGGFCLYLCHEVGGTRDAGRGNDMQSRSVGGKCAVKLATC